MRRLQKAAAEDDFFEEIQFIEEQLADALNEKEAALHKGQEARQQKERAIQLLLDSGMPKEEISRQLGLSQAEIEDF